MKTIWKQRVAKGEASEKEIINLKEMLNLPEKILRTLISRGYSSAEEITNFLEPRLGKLHNPLLLPDMDKAINRILEAKKNKELIAIYGDYDVDGTTGVAILVKYLKANGFNVIYEIPNRLKEGYGMNVQGIDRLRGKNVSLVISVDNGIGAFEQVEYANSIGMDVIITDHHECQDGFLPNALAVINAKRLDSKYPFRELCGAGIAFKLIQGLDLALKLKSDMSEYIQCVSIATVADIVPLVDENRILVANGIEQMNQQPLNNGVKALINISGIKKITAGNIGFVLGPKINAAGRLGDANEILSLYLTECQEEAANIAINLDKKNKERQLIEEAIFEEAKELVLKNRLYENSVLVISGKGWHSGVIGIVASRLQDLWYCPVVVIGIDESGMGRGSCRSVEGINIFDALGKCRGCFESFGGHSQAAGFSIKEERISQMSEQLIQVSRDEKFSNYCIKTYYYDLLLKPEDIGHELMCNIEKFEPYGVGNPAPIVLFENIKPQNFKRIGRDANHIFFMIPPVRCVGFNIDTNLFENEAYSYLGKLEYNEFKGEKNIQLMLKDFKNMPFSERSEALEYVQYFINDIEGFKNLKFSDREKEGMQISREELVRIYKMIEQFEGKFLELKEIKTTLNTNYFKLILGLNILKEAHLINYSLVNEKNVSAVLLKVSKKKDIKKVPLMLELNAYLQ